MGVVRLIAPSFPEPALCLAVSAEQFGPDVDQVALGLGAEHAPKIRLGQLGHRPPPRYIEVPPPYSARRAGCRASKPPPPQVWSRRIGPPSTGWATTETPHWDV